MKASEAGLQEGSCLFYLISHLIRKISPSGDAETEKEDLCKVQSNSSTVLFSISERFLVAAQMCHDVPTSLFILGQQ